MGEFQLKKRLIILIAVVLIGALVFSVFYHTLSSQQSKQTYVGVAFCGDTTEQALLLIDRVKNYTNLFILQSGPISMDENATKEICDYAVDSGLNIIVYFGDLAPRILAEKGLEWRTDFTNGAKQRYGERFLGVYYYDERGGIYLDTDKQAHNWTIPANATYSSVAQTFVNGFLREGGTVNLKAANVPMYASDYALYWFDYLSGYDVMLAQIGWNHSLTQDIALLRGAARMQDKDWGIIITWKYNQPPYLDTGETIYQQMLTSYRAGAKYITIFNYPYNNQTIYGTMKDEHFEALQRIWNTVKSGNVDPIKADSVLVLPKDYGFGMRRLDDTIWGFWEPDQYTAQVWNSAQTLMARHGYSLDIIYDDPNYPLNGQYANVYLWNSTAL
ncbi:MAG: hypothetical protein ACFCUE_01025 [Candidatus Bathyarchaeia archaeon]